MTSPIMHWSLDNLTHLVEALTILGVGWRVLRKLTRIIDALENFPPHRHVPGGAILYPVGFEPPVMGKINGEAAAAAPIK